MQAYTRLYLDYFNYGIDDFIPCEICFNRANDIHHIKSRSKRKDLLNNITNTMALCRKCHDIYGDKKQYYDFLQMSHEQFMKNFKINTL